MKKSLIAQSVTAVIAGLGFASVANALVVGPIAAAAPVINTTAIAADTLVVDTDGLGHINLVPYYTVQSGFDTYVNIVNTDMAHGKAVKVRFRGASNSDDVFDFTLLMSPGDKFAFALTKDAATGLPMLVKAPSPNDDTSCTLGGTSGNGINAINGEKFVTARLKSQLTGDALANEAREGYIEILNMADIPVNNAAGSLYTGIKHVVNSAGKYVAPCTPANLAVMGTNPTSYNGVEATSAINKGLEVPTTGLMTNWTVINVAKAASYTGAAVAVEARDTATGVPGYGNIVMFAQNNVAVPYNSLTDPATRYTSDPLLRGGYVAAANYDFPDLSTPYLNDALDGTGIVGGTTEPTTRRPFWQASFLTSSLAVTSVANEFLSYSGLDAKTDWIFSFPTRRYNIAVQYGATDTIRWSDLSLGLTVGTYTAVNYFVENTAVAPAVNGNVIKNPDEPTKAYQLCVTGIGYQTSAAAAALAPYTSAVTNDFDEWLFGPTDPGVSFVISPAVPGVAPTLAFCGEVAVFKFNATATETSVLGASVAVKGLEMPYDNGWTRLATPGLGATATTGAGLPIIGSAVTELNNTGAAGAGYGQTFPHRKTR